MNLSVVLVLKTEKKKFRRIEYERGDFCKNAYYFMNETAAPN